MVCGFDLTEKKMAAAAETTQLHEKFNNLTINNCKVLEAVPKHVANPIGLELPLEEVYKLSLSFYKEKEGKAVNFSYEDKLQLVAFTQQVLHGPFSEAESKLTPLGTLDVVGKSRRLAWQKLGDLSTDQARAGFIELLSRKCPLFTAFLQAHQTERRERERLAFEEQKKKLLAQEEQLKKDEEEKVIKEQLEKEEALKRQIQQALNEQTYEQFKNYAEQQYPGDPEKQGTLIRQLQDQHYIQYMQQLQAACVDSINGPTKDDSRTEESDVESTHLHDGVSCTQSLEEVMPASMWIRTDIQAFKQAISETEGDSVVRVGHGETVTVRVPTHREGSRIFWEFATDHYDIGFGVYFEYCTPVTDEVSVHVSESDDEDQDGDEELEDEEGVIHPADFEAGSLATELAHRPLIMEIVPVFRRDCQKDVYAGSHAYPGQGVYLLKFDNSYSLWRSKTLYYRVYYSQ